MACPGIERTQPVCRVIFLNMQMIRQSFLQLQVLDWVELMCLDCLEVAVH